MDFDRWAAEKVMGWEILYRCPECGGGGEYGQDRFICYMCKGKGYIEEEPPQTSKYSMNPPCQRFVELHRFRNGKRVFQDIDWHPTTDLNHLFMVVEKMRELDWSGGIDWYQTSLDDLHSAWFANLKDVYPKEFRAAHENRNLAVLMAAKKALEGE